MGIQDTGEGYRVRKGIQGTGERFKVRKDTDLGKGNRTQSQEEDIGYRVWKGIQDTELGGGYGMQEEDTVLLDGCREEKKVHNKK